MRVVAIFFLFPQNSRHLTTDLTINFASSVENCVTNFTHARYKIERLLAEATFCNASSHSENVASARRVARNHKLHEIEILQLNILQILGKSGTKFQLIHLDRKA